MAGYAGIGFGEDLQTIVTEHGVEEVVPVVTVGLERKRFVRISKVDPKMQRILLGEDAKRMSSTDVIEQVRTLKDTVWDSHMGKPAKGQRRYGGQTLQARALKARRLAMPETCHITAPTFGDLGGFEMLVELSRPGRALVMELTLENLNYIRSALLWQLANGASPMKRQRTIDVLTLPNCVVAAETWTNFKYMACHDKQGRGSKGTACRFFTSNLEEAEAFALTGQKPAGTPEGEACEEEPEDAPKSDEEHSNEEEAQSEQEPEQMEDPESDEGAAGGAAGGA